MRIIKKLKKITKNLEKSAKQYIATPIYTEEILSLVESNADDIAMVTADIEDCKMSTLAAIQELKNQISEINKNLDSTADATKPVPKKRTSTSKK